MSSYTVGPIYGPAGSLQRARLYAPDATETDVALAEVTPQTFSGTVSLATTPDATWNYEVRQVATQDAAGFDGSTTEIISYGSLGYLFASQVRTFPLSINLGLTGKAATLYYHVVNDADGTDLVARTNANVIETAAAGQYYVTGGASWDAAINATVLWDETVTGATASESWPAQSAVTLTSAYDAAKTAASQTSVTTAATNILDAIGDINPVAITPFSATVSNPRYATRDLPPVAQGSAPTDVWVITDAVKSPVDLSGKTLRFVVYKITDANNVCDPLDDVLLPVYQYETGGGGIVISGDDSNSVSVTHSADNLATAGVFYYWLLNVTDHLPLAQGKMPVKPCTWSV